MDKSKIIKVAIAALICILAIAYAILNSKNSTDYDMDFANEIIVENKIEETNQEEKSLIKVYITGEVNNPGVIELEEGARIQDAIEGAGGIKSEANLKNINLAYEIADGEKIYIPNLAEESSEENIEKTSLTSNNSNANASNSSSGKVNINKATAIELTSVPGIGDSTAKNIIAYREENGKFKTIEDIKNVSGIGNNKYESMKDHICVK